MPDGTGQEIHRLAERRRAWRQHRDDMEARSQGRRWRGHLRSGLYGLAWHTHNVLRPTGAFRWGASRALMLELVQMSASFPDLPAAFDGYRILHLTDLHLDNIEDTAAVAAERIADIKHDLCVITGDIRDNIHAPLAPLIRRLETIVAASKAGDGIIAVLGNHDSASMVAPMEALGIRVLLNECMTLVRAMDVLHVTGLDDVHRFHTEAADAALAAAPDAFCIALVHSPEVASLAAARHRVYLTGHTHGGQICWPGGRAFTNSLKQHRELARGLWHHGDMLGYTNRGVGSCVVPFRSYCPGEVMVMTLRRGPEQVSFGSTFGTI
jgi:predicted MPP superfamily phosphohydrolase